MHNLRNNNILAHDVSTEAVFYYFDTQYFQTHSTKNADMNKMVWRHQRKILENPANTLCPS